MGTVETKDEFNCTTQEKSAAHRWYKKNPFITRAKKKSQKDGPEVESSSTLPVQWWAVKENHYAVDDARVVHSHAIPHRQTTRLSQIAGHLPSLHGRRHWGTRSRAASFNSWVLAFTSRCRTPARDFLGKWLNERRVGVGVEGATACGEKPNYIAN